MGACCRWPTHCELCCTLMKRWFPRERRSARLAQTRYPWTSCDLLQPVRTLAGGFRRASEGRVHGARRRRLRATCSSSRVTLGPSRRRRRSADSLPDTANGEVYLVRSQLRTQMHGRPQSRRATPAAVGLGLDTRQARGCSFIYALGKELEDLGDLPDKIHVFLATGARLHGEAQEYQVAADADAPRPGIRATLQRGVAREGATLHAD